MKIEGKNAVTEALNAGVTIDKVLFASGVHDKTFNDCVALVKSKKIKFQMVSADVLNRESVTKKHQGVIAYAVDYKYSSVEEILALANEKKEDPFILILDGIEDPHNLGSIIRVCDCLGVHGVIIGKNRACTVNETVIKVSAGAAAHVKVAKVTNINNTIENLKKQGVWVYACELGGEDLTKSKLNGSIAIVIGSEGKGVSALTKKLCDGVVTIPMRGKVNSLNASVATGIVLYEVMKQK